MFKVTNGGCNKCWISDGNSYFLHSDGRAINNCVEYYPNEKDAQAVLDKFYPKPQHVWKHGDVFVSSNGNTMIYFNFCAGRKPQAVCVEAPVGGPSLNLENSLRNAKFLFNIKEKI